MTILSPSHHPRAKPSFRSEATVGLDDGPGVLRKRMGCENDEGIYGVGHVVAIGEDLRACAFEMKVAYAPLIGLGVESSRGRGQRRGLESFRKGCRRKELERERWDLLRGFGSGSMGPERYCATTGAMDCRRCRGVSRV